MRRLLIVVPLLIARAAWPQGTPQGAEFRVNSFTTDRQRAPDVAADPSGGFVVVWSSTQDGAYGVYGQRYDPSGAPLGPEFLVSHYTPQPAAVFRVAPAVATDPSGNFVVVWESDGVDGYGLAIVGQRFGGSGVPLGPQFQVNSYTTFNQYQPDVAVDGSGNFVVVWENNPGDGTGGILGQRYASSGAPVGPEFLVSNSTADFQRLTAAAATAGGDFLIVWSKVGHGVWGRRFAGSGAPLDDEFAVTGLQDQLSPDVASASGDFVVVWSSYFQDGSYRGVFGRRFAGSGGPLGPEFRVNTYTTYSQAFPSVATDISGNFVVVWSGFGSGDSSGIFGQRFASSSVPLGSEFHVNTYTAQSQGRPSVGADSAGNFVVVWTSYSQDGSDGGIFGQRYSEILPVDLTGFFVE